jgi:hypothetical protein
MCVCGWVYDFVQNARSQFSSYRSETLHLDRGSSDLKKYGVGESLTPWGPEWGAKPPPQFFLKRSYFFEILYLDRGPSVTPNGGVGESFPPWEPGWGVNPQIFEISIPSPWFYSYSPEMLQLDRERPGSPHPHPTHSSPLQGPGGGRILLGDWDIIGDGDFFLK